MGKILSASQFPLSKSYNSLQSTVQFFINYPIYTSIIGIYSEYHEKVKNSSFSRCVPVEMTVGGNEDHPEGGSRGERRLRSLCARGRPAQPAPRMITVLDGMLT